jgi:hypothetical protein
VEQVQWDCLDTHGTILAGPVCVGGVETLSDQHGHKSQDLRKQDRRPQTHFLRLLLAFLTTLLFVCPSHAKGAAIAFVNGNYPDDTLNYALVDLGVHLMSWFEGCHSQTQPPAKLTGQVEKVKLPGPETQKLLLGPRTTKKISAVGLARKFGIRVPGASPSSKSFTLPTEKAARLTPLDQRGGTRKPRGRFSLNGVSRVRA